jgi:hypothetical protein
MNRKVEVEPNERKVEPKPCKVQPKRGKDEHNFPNL